MSICDPCDLCCLLASVEKNTTRIRDGEEIEHTCHKLFWRCQCSGGTLTMQFNIPGELLGEWEDIADWEPDGEGYYFPCPLQANGSFRMKCTIGDTVFYSNTVVLSGTTTVGGDCHCVDGSFSYKYQIEVDFTYYPDGGELEDIPPYSTGFSSTAIYFVPRPFVSGPDPDAGSGPGPVGFNAVLTSTGPSFPCGNTGNVSVFFQSGVKPVSFGGDGEETVSTYERLMNSQQPCHGLLTCNPGVMTLVETNSTGHHPIYHGGQESILGGDRYFGYLTIDEVRAVIVLC